MSNDLICLSDRYVMSAHARIQSVNGLNKWSL
jgi:hypothetical protein